MPDESPEVLLNACVAYIDARRKQLAYRESHGGDDLSLIEATRQAYNDLVYASPIGRHSKVDYLIAALRSAPMPIRESVLKGQDWHDAYDAWWHANASEAAIYSKTTDNYEVVNAPK